MRFVKVADLEPEMILAQPVLDLKGHMMLAQNAKLSTYTIMKLDGHNYKGVYIYDEISEGIEVIETIPMDLRLKTIQATQELNIDSCIFLSSQIVDTVRESEFVETNMTNLCIFDNDTYNHCVNVAMYVARTAITMGYTQDQIVKFTTAALLHDVGKTKISQTILNKPGPLTDEERILMNKHPEWGYEMVKDDQDLSAVSKVGILEHHENWDGSGYPRGLQGEDIHECARLLHVCDVYEAMISKRAYKDKINPTEVIEYLYGGCGIMFDVRVVTAFLSRLLPFPKGITLLMSDGRKAIVYENNISYPTRPVVIMLDNAEKVNLLDVNNVTIVGLDDI